MAEQVLAVLRADPDQRVVAADARQVAGQVAHVGEEIAPLRGQQVDQVDALGLRLQPGGLRRDEVDVRVGRDPALPPPVERALDGQRQLALARLDDQAPAHGPVLEALGDLDVDLADGQLDLELAVHVGVLRSSRASGRRRSPRTSCR